MPSCSCSARREPAFFAPTARPLDVPYRKNLKDFHPELGLDYVLVVPDTAVGMRKLATRGSLGALAFAICVAVLVVLVVEALPRFGDEVFSVSAILWLIAFLLFTLSWFWQERRVRKRFLQF